MRSTDLFLKFPVLIGDIGGTHARFQMLTDAHAAPKSFDVLNTADFKTVEEAIQAGVLDKTSHMPRSFVLAAAGPIHEEGLELTNCDWKISPKSMIEEFRLSDVVLLNDFAAQSMALTALQDDELLAIGNGEKLDDGARIVIGPGTGLGVAALVRSNDTWIPVPGEGGHIDIGPRSERDYEIWPNIKKIEGRVSAEQVICGRGLVHIYEAIIKTDGGTAKFSKPSDISTAALDGSDNAAVEAVELFSTYLGRVAGDVALIYMASGGVYIGGGIANKIAPAIAKSGFRAAFEDKAPHTELMRQMPTFIVQEPFAALVGLAKFARMPNLFGIDMRRRHWTS